jgi:hypothetical protein
MKKFLVGFMAIKALVVLIVFFFGFAASASAPNDNQAAECEAALNENFYAFNYEDVDKLMDTIAVSASDAGHREDFRSEAERLFEEEDVYIQLAFFDPFWVQGNKLRAMVIQTTTRKGDEEGTSAYNEFRTRSNLLPPWRHSYYLQEFEYDKKSKKWLVGAIIGRPKSIWDPAKGNLPPRLREQAQKAATEKAAGNRCKDGTCSTPLVELRMK